MNRTFGIVSFTELAIVLSLSVCFAPAHAQIVDSPHRFESEHAIRTTEGRLRYRAVVEEFLIADRSGDPALSLFVTTYLRKGVRDPDSRPVIFLFNGGPSGAAFMLHMQLGPREPDRSVPGNPDTPTKFVDNPDTLLGVADLVFFDPAETGFSRMLPGKSRDWFYSTEGDVDSVAQLVRAWLQRHGREHSPRYILGESYGSVRANLAAQSLGDSKPLDGLILFGQSLPLMETSRRTNNIVSTAVSLPMLAIVAAYHGKADMRGKSGAAFVDEVWEFAMRDYLPALARGNQLPEYERQRIATRLESYIGIRASYLVAHKLTIAKQDFRRELIPGKLLDLNDGRALLPADARGEPQSRSILADYMANELHVTVPGVDYRLMAPDAFFEWEWGSGCSEYLQGAGLCDPKSPHRTIFVDYDWPTVLAKRFAAQPTFRTMIVGGWYDTLSSIGTTRYMVSREDFPRDRIEVHEYAAGHATAEDPQARKLIVRDIAAFLARGAGSRNAP